MTRMLANLSKVNCYNRTGMNEKLVQEIILQSAKENLLNVAFFGIVDEQEKTQFLFEQTFGIKFIENLKQKEITHVSQLELDKGMEQRILETNSLDVLFYEFARDLFLQRVEEMENRQGYSVREYFHHVRDSIQSASINDMTNNEASDEDNEDAGEEEEKLMSYPSKGTADTSMLGKTKR
ncbi:unnamed protein product [Lymnaea stagnalis]|uniref:Heparan-sulfate 6-O-sulfotransferase n=1 Tax=Lymnaea stagnalis TaxID=6523 RepID=A0AAV2INP1_LYMST